MKNSIFSLMLCLLSVALFTSCEKDDDATPANLVELAQNTDDLSSLVEAITYADLAGTLSGTTEYTVFAPTNAAFADLLADFNVSALQIWTKAVVTKLLLNHVVAGTVNSNQLTEGYVEMAATYGAMNYPIKSFVNLASGVKVNGATVTTPDLGATNGVVHIVDKVITLPTVVTTALDNPNFSILVQALTRPDLNVDYVGLLSGDGPFTVFAPTNDAFLALLAELGVSSLDDIDADTLNAVLQYHVVASANVRSADLSNEQVVTTYGGSDLTIDLTNGAQIVDAKGRIANIAVVDVQSDNGIVHAIDKVILP